MKELKEKLEENPMNKEQIKNRLKERLLKALDEIHGYTYSMPFNLSEQDIEELLEVMDANQPANTTDSDSVFIGPAAGLDTGFIVPEPPKSAGVPNVQDRMQEIHHKFGTSEKANYEIQLFFDECLKAALTAQAQDFEAQSELLKEAVALLELWNEMVPDIKATGLNPLHAIIKTKQFLKNQ